jgi:hypothetical protein
LIPGLSPLVAIAGIVTAIAQSGCDGKSRGPTAIPVPDPYVSSVTYLLLVEPWSEGREYPRAAEVLVDGETYWEGPIEAPALNGYVGYYDQVPSSLVIEGSRALSTGSHTLTFRVTDQRRSPTGYYISGYVDIVWSNRRVVRAAAWESVLVQLRTGQDWTTEFVVAPSL